LSEKNSPTKATEPKIPEPSPAEIRDLFTKANIPLPAIELMGPARLYGKLLKDNAAATGGTAFSDIHIRKEAAPLSRQRNVSGDDDNVLEQLRKALENNDAAAKPSRKVLGSFTLLSDWVQHYLVWAFAASATKQTEMISALNHLGNVCQVATQQNLTIALTYDHKVRKTLSADVARDPTTSRDKALSTKNESVIAEILNRAPRFDSMTPDVMAQKGGNGGNNGNRKGAGKGKGNATNNGKGGKATNKRDNAKRVRTEETN
jgi:hypothetical protein